MMGLLRWSIFHKDLEGEQIYPKEHDLFEYIDLCIFLWRTNKSQSLSPILPLPLPFFCLVVAFVDLVWNRIQVRIAALCFGSFIQLMCLVDSIRVKKIKMCICLT